MGGRGEGRLKDRMTRDRGRRKGAGVKDGTNVWEDRSKAGSKVDGVVLRGERRVWER